MTITITVGNTIIVNVTAGDAQFALDVTEALQELLQPLIDYALANRPPTPMDEAMRYILENADEKTKLGMKGLFPKWMAGVIHKFGEIYEFNDELWEVIHQKPDPETGEERGFRSQEDWIPPNAVSLYRRIVEPGTVGKWVQPQGAHDAYKMGDKAYHPTPEIVWEVTQTDANGNNVWEPGVFGWTRVQE